MQQDGVYPNLEYRKSGDHHQNVLCEHRQEIEAELSGDTEDQGEHSEGSEFHDQIDDFHHHIGKPPQNFDEYLRASGRQWPQCNPKTSEKKDNA